MTSASALRLKKKAADFESKKQLDKALALYIQLLEESGVDLDDADLQLYNRVGDLLMRQGNVTDALGWYEKAVDVYADRGFLNNAIALCNKILRQSPARSAVYYKLGKISASKGFKSDAKKNFLEYADRMQKSGQIDEAFRALKEFADLCPDQDDIRLMLADWLTKENRKSEAVEQLETLYGKLEAEGRSAEARATIDRIKAIDPEVVPRVSGAWMSQKSSDLVFLDLVEDAPQPRHQLADEENAPPSLPSPTGVHVVPALEGLTLTFHPEVDDAERASAAALERLLEEAQGAEADVAADTLAALGLQAQHAVASPSPLDARPADGAGADAGDAASDEFLAIDLDALLTQPPRVSMVSLEVQLPYLTPEGSDPTDAPPIDLLRVMGTPIGTPIILERASASLGGLDLLDLGDAPAPDTTSELVAIDGSGRATDEFLVVDADGEALDTAGSELDDERRGDEGDEGDEGDVLPVLSLGSDTTPDAWVEAALGASDDRSFDHLLTPLSVGTVGESTGGEGGDAARDGVRADHVPFSDIEAAKAEAAEFDEYGGTESVEHASAVDLGTSEGAREQAIAEASEGASASEPVDEVPVDTTLAVGTDESAGAEFAEAASVVATQPMEDAQPTGDLQQDLQRPDSGEDTQVPTSLEAFFGAPHRSEGEIDLLDELTPPFMRDPSAEAAAEPFTSGEVDSAIAEALPFGVDVGGVEGTEAGNDGIDDRPDEGHASATSSEEAAVDPVAEAARQEAPWPAAARRAGSALDTTSLHAAIAAALPSPTGDGEEGKEHTPGTDDSASPDEQGYVDAAFRDRPIELPMLDVGTDADDVLAAGDAEAYPAYDPTQRDTPEDFLAQDDARDVDDTQDEHFGGESAPPAEGSVPDEWSPDAVAEVLIDGEWRDESVGDLLADERSTAPSSTSPTSPTSSTSPPTRFDDLAAAMLWLAGDSDGQDARIDDASDETEGDATHRRRTPHGTLSFGGVEAQLRRRLELDPSNWTLRRQLGEELMGLGEREAGLAELEAAMTGFEQLGDLEEARKVADSVLRTVPTSVRHHQKRVEYAVRSGDRPRLVEAYVELADALFRNGDSDKAHVVYSRVLELSPTNQRARLALGLIAPDAESAPSGYAGTGISERRVPTGAMAALFSPLASEPSASGAPLPAPLAPESASLDDAPLTPSGQSTGAAAGSATRSSEGSRSETAPAAPATPLPAAPPDAAEEYIDLGDWLRAAEPVRSTRMITTDVAPTGDEQADFDDMLRRFKQGVAENVDEEDFASHYDLGVAFKEMGLTDDAISEFQKSLRGDEHRVRSYEALGQCFVEKGQMQVAVTLLRRAVESTGADDQQLVGVLYLLGFANESMERHRDALGYYQRVFAVDIEFRDVAQRVAAMEHRTQ